MAEKLNEREKLFVKHYPLENFNGTKAAIKAGYSAKTARQQATRMLTKVSIRTALAKSLEPKAKKLELTKDRLMQEVARLAFSDIRNVAEFDSSGMKLKASGEGLLTEPLTDDAAATIASITQSDTQNGRNISVRLWDKTKNLELAARIVNILDGASDSEDNDPLPLDDGDI